MKPHRTDFVSLIFGLIFLAIAGAGTATGLFGLRAPSFGWFVAGGAIVLGLIGIMGALLPRRGPAPAVTAPQAATDQSPEGSARSTERPSPQQDPTPAEPIRHADDE